jgi:NADH:ubiquinone oxidoreductase subunit K
MTIENVLIVSAALFAIGAYGVISRRSLITVIMSLELMFNGVVITAVAFSRLTPSAALLSGDPVTAEAVRSALTGHVFAIFVIAVAAGEAALAFALVFAIYRARESIEITDASEMKN